MPSEGAEPHLVVAVNKWVYWVQSEHELEELAVEEDTVEGPPHSSCCGQDSRRTRGAPLLVRWGFGSTNFVSSTHAPGCSPHHFVVEYH